ncbi:hypothetical protein [Tissierella sp.]|uniref:hypothetical protein n=1 Tax=Tissierella sp. TaxID=41274 RepID=UPI0028AF8010|nr:hypothetical protein [Tissierella sp.]
MALVLLSILGGYIGIAIGAVLNNELYETLFLIVGILSPALITLERIYKEMSSKSD